MLLSPPCGITGCSSNFLGLKRAAFLSLSSQEIWICFASLHPEQLLWVCLSARPRRYFQQKHSHPNRSSFTDMKSIRAVFCHLCCGGACRPADVGKGCRAPELATGLLFLVVGPNPAFFCVPNMGIPRASQGLDLDEPDPLSWQCSSLSFLGVIPDSHWCEGESCREGTWSCRLQHSCDSPGYFFFLNPAWGSSSSGD